MPHNPPMCLIAFRWDPDREPSLLVAANRDEAYARPSAPAAFWPGDRILAGHDLLGGGTWLGITRDGRFAALANVRSARPADPGAPSRGRLVAEFLAGREPAPDFLDRLRTRAGAYNGFNLLLFDGSRPVGYEHPGDRVLAFAPGIHAVANARFDTPWPKVGFLKAGLEADPDPAALFRLLADPTPAPDGEVPPGPLPPERERALSAVFVRTPDYGTRTSTVVQVGRDRIRFMERRFDHGRPAGESRFDLPRPSS